jgi:hypothetical protein
VLVVRMLGMRDARQSALTPTLREVQESHVDSSGVLVTEETGQGCEALNFGNTHRDPGATIRRSSANPIKSAARRRHRLDGRLRTLCSPRASPQQRLNAAVVLGHAASGIVGELDLHSPSHGETLTRSRDLLVRTAAHR